MPSLRLVTVDLDDVPEWTRVVVEKWLRRKMAEAFGNQIWSYGDNRRHGRCWGAECMMRDCLWSIDDLDCRADALELLAWHRANAHGLEAHT